MEDDEEAATDPQEGFLGEASVPLSAAQVPMPSPCHAITALASFSEAEGATSDAPA